MLEHIKINNSNRILFHLSGVFILLIAVVAAYGNTLNSPFVFDDLENIVRNDFLKIESLSRASIAYVWQAPHPSETRKIANFTFALNFYFGGLDPFWYHIVNILIHIICGLLIGIFLYNILNVGWLQAKYSPNIRSGLAWSAAFIWALHPIQINAVTYIVQRMTSLATMFGLLAMIFWLFCRKSWLQKHYRLSVFWALIGIFSWLCGLLSKENVAIIPVLILITEYFLFKQGKFSWNFTWGKMLLLVSLVFLFLTVSIFYYLGPTPWNRILVSYGQREFTLLERVMTQCRVLWHYISLYLFPLPDRLALLHDYPLSRSLFLPMTTFISICFWFVTIGAAWFYRTRYPLFSWTTAWFLAAHSIESTIIPLEIIFEHRMYLPSVGLSLGVAIVGYTFLSKFSVRPRIRIFTLIGILLILCTSTYVRNMDFKNNITLYLADLQKYPESRRMRLNLALALTRVGKVEEGREILEKLAREFPKNITIQQNWLIFLSIKLKDHQGADIAYYQLLELLDSTEFSSIHDSTAIWNLARFYQKQGNQERSLFLTDFLLDYFDYDSLWFLKGQSHVRKGDWMAAVEAFKNAWLRNPEDPPILYWYGKSLVQIGQRAEGCQLLSKAAQNLVNKKAADRSRKFMGKHCDDI